MSKSFIYIVFFSFLNFFGLAAQGEEIVADVTTGCDSLEVSFSLANADPIEDYYSISWSLGDGTIIKDALSFTHLYSSPGIYDVNVTLDEVRVISKSEYIAVGLTPLADFTFRDSSWAGEEFRYVFEPVHFNPVEGIAVNYEWTVGQDGSISNDSVFAYTFSGDSQYAQISLSVTDELGCSDSTSKHIPVSKVLLYSNVFTPNADGVNDYFEVEVPGDFNFLFKVFTAKGLLVYSSESSRIVWDGRTVGGRDVHAGVYYFIIEGVDTPVEVREKGFIHLYR